MALRALLDALPAADGLLPAWHEWWPPELMRELVPDDALRSTLVAEMPRVPRSFFEEAVTLPGRWWFGPAAYLQLSAAYEEERARADQWGWPTSRLEGKHLDVTSRPAIVAAEIRNLTAAIRGAKRTQASST